MATLEKTITISTELRPCYADGKKALFHRWTENDYEDKNFYGIIQVDTRLKEKAIQRLKDKISRGEYTPVGKIEVLRKLRAVVEYEDGKIEEVAPSQIRFADNKINEFAFLEENEVNPNCAAPPFRKGSPPPTPKKFYSCPNCGELIEAYNGDILKEGKKND